MALRPAARVAHPGVAADQDELLESRRLRVTGHARKRCQAGPKDASWPKTQVGPCPPAGIQHCYKRLKLAQLLGQHLGVFLNVRMAAQPAPHGVRPARGPMHPNAKSTELAQILGRRQAADRNFQPKCWANLHNLVQPSCEFRVRLGAIVQRCAGAS
jgi:hypothetical protein